MKHYLFTTYYRPVSAERKAEYDFCIEKNKHAFDAVYLFVEEADMIEAMNFGVEVIKCSNRPTYRDYFNFISSFSESVNIIANTDIFFFNMQQIDQNLHRLRSGETCFALTRYDYHFNSPSYLFDRPDSQDTWVFMGNKRLNLVEYAEFSLGEAGCDNRIAHELSKAGFEVLNPSLTIQTFHLHEIPERSYLQHGEIKRIPPPYLLLTPTE